MRFRLGRSIAQIIPFYRIPIPTLPVQNKDDGFITTKILILMAVVAVASILVLLL